MAGMEPLQVIAEPRRRQILRMVWDSELQAGDIAQGFDVTFGAISQHLAVLRDAGYVQVRKDGNKRFYRADKDQLGPLRSVLETMWVDTLDQLAKAIERNIEEGTA
jgi:DNA-binding transcriptional ArsR family regulator